MLARFPRQIVWIEWDAMTADAWPGIKRHETERLRRRRANHFPRVDVERVTEPRHLICHADVDGAKRVFEKLRRFGHTRRANSVNVVDYLRIEMRRNQRRIIRHAADTF